jgi:predicted DNA-binding protein with PD1-like motif
MSTLRRMETKDRLVGKLDYGSDLLEELNEVCRRRDIRLAWFEGLGAVQKACLSYYDQQMREYQPLEIDRALEITQLTGNVSLKDGIPFVHAHVTLADRAGHAYGGHLAPGTIVFACEFRMEILEGPVLERVFDQTTGLFLWGLSD